MPSFNSFLKDYDAALPPYDGGIAIVAPRLTPLIIGTLQLRAYEVMYTPDSAYGAIQAIRETQVSVITGIPILSATYRMLDTAIRGTQYEEVTPGVIEPAIPPFVDTSYGTNGIIYKLDTLGVLQAQFQVLLDGAPDTEISPDGRSFRQQLGDILDALLADDTTTDDQIALLQAILAAIGPVA